MSAEITSKPIDPPTDFELLKDIFCKAADAYIVCYLTRKLSYRAGLAYGGMAGVIQFIFSNIHQKIDKSASLDAIKKLNYILSAYMPWMISGVILRQIHKLTGNDTLSITSGMGLSIALIQQIWGRGNIHLLPKD